MMPLYADEVKTVVREAWEKVAPKHPHQRPGVLVPISLGTRLSKTFRQEVREWGFVDAVENRQAGPPPFEHGAGSRWLTFHCKSFAEVTEPS